MVTLTRAFKHFNASPTNIRYSWSAFTREKTKLVCTLWQHEFDGRKYTLWGKKWTSESSGWSEQRRNLDEAIKYRIPVVGFIVIAKDPTASDLKVASAKTDRLFHMTIIEQDADWIVGEIAGVEK